MKCFHQLKFHMVGMIKEAQGESGNRVVAPVVEKRCNFFVTIDIPSITTTLKNYLLLR